MQNEDGSTGGHWTEAQTSTVAQSIGLKWDKITPKEWNVTMNMMYSDYVRVAEKFKTTGADFYAALAQAFLFDKDGGDPKKKLAGYFSGIVSPNFIK